MILLSAALAAGILEFARVQGASSRPALALPPILGLDPDPGAEPRAVARPPAAFAILGIRVRFAQAGEAVGSPRSKEEARAVAGAVALAARARGADFEALARSWSDEAESASRGGFLATVRANRERSVLERALSRAAIGGVAGPFELPDGFWVAKRIPCEPLAYQAVLVAWRGVAPIRSPVSRTREEAGVRAQDLAQRAAADPEGFDALVAAESDDPDARAKRGAVPPVFRGEMVDALDGAVRETAVGSVAGPIETPLGFLVIRRAAVDWITFDNVLVQFAGAEGAPLTQARTREEASERARAIAGRAREAGIDFARLAVETTDTPNANESNLRRTLPVSLGSPKWLRELAGLAVGDVAVLESPSGFHVARRVETEPE